MSDDSRYFYTQDPLQLPKGDPVLTGIARLETKLDAIVAAQELERQDRIREDAKLHARVDHHDDRIVVLEKGHARKAGVWVAIGTIGTIAGSFGGYLSNFFHKIGL